MTQLLGNYESDSTKIAIIKTAT